LPENQTSAVLTIDFEATGSRVSKVTNIRVG